MIKTPRWIYGVFVFGVLGLIHGPAQGAPKSWDVVKDFWWSGVGEIDGKQEESLSFWKGLARPSKPNEWSYGTINCTGGSPDDPYPKQIDGICAKADREPFVQFNPFKASCLQRKPSRCLLTSRRIKRKKPGGRRSGILASHGTHWPPVSTGQAPGR